MFGFSNNDDKDLKNKYLEDKKLVKRILAGDETAFKHFFDLYYTRAYRYCLRRANEHDAEEVALAAIQQAMRKVDTYRGEAALLTWIYQITRHELSSHYRRNEKYKHQVLIDDNETVRDEVEAMAADISNSPEAGREREERQHLIHHMLDYLPADYGKLLEWKYVQGLSVDEIAEKLETTNISVQSKLARARVAFKAHYENLEMQLTAS